MVRDNFFSRQVSENLGYYVYRIIDPRNGLTFYVGKGTEDRIFYHEQGAKAAKTESKHVIEPLVDALVNERLKAMAIDQAQAEQVRAEVQEELAGTVDRKNITLNAIRKAKLKPVYIIHRHGMDENTAFEVEAALIDAYPGLTNHQGGHYSEKRGVASILQVKQNYDCQVMVDPKHLGHKVLAFNVRLSSYAHDLYNAVRFAWSINIDRAREADLIFAMEYGVCRGVFVATEWKRATIENFPHHGKHEPKRWGFDGRQADTQFQDIYEGKQLPDHLKRKRGAASPFRYFGAWPHNA